MTSTTDQATQTARDYYNSDDADRFYSEVWGGEDIHVGLYRSDDEPIKDASRRTVDHLADQLEGIDSESVVLDIGAGYGGAARRLVQRFGCRVICVNLSEAENQRNRELNAAAGIDDRIEVIDGSFEQLSLEDESVDFVWSQDAILHSGDRSRVFREVDRVLKPGGRFVFTDPMQSDDCPAGVLDPILARIHLSDLGSPGFYQKLGGELGWRDLGFEDHTGQLANHYRRVLETTEQRSADLTGKISADYLERMKAGLKHWIDGGTRGHLAWGVFQFEKPA
ncbi:methyltransferase domain-containing protein [Roseiconus nitratireducens]|uniref:Methyltransferase domain-containing protein n=1 Tax=Roseiconus nitratireducens TaxID=2605748 RepID=A0A5M6CYJ6_9BACT|nr:class I SAM-dependent methyltransferase [Roseiconus nitratireducens]KAA5539072.1 methyltransferase domain-containing protein [Roseiconus nitratireducens]